MLPVPGVFLFLAMNFVANTGSVNAPRNSGNDWFVLT